MIPLHRPAFGLGTVIVSALTNGPNCSVQALEEAYAAATGCAWAVWLPSARAGICWALRASITPGARVLTPAFTCAVVHEAVVRSGGSIHLADPAPDDFLLDPQAIVAAQAEDEAVVLSEPYGHAYDLTKSVPDMPPAPALRIVDMAMSLPHPALFQRLQPSDFAVISFGTGKSMYAGWGAVGFTSDRQLAEEVRKIRDAALAQSGWGLAGRRFTMISLRTAAHYPWVYSLARKLRDQGRLLLSSARWAGSPEPTPARTEAAATALPNGWSAASTAGPEWSLPSTHLDRRLALWNLEQTAAAHQTRLALARRYHQNLEGARGLARPKPSPYALSHYTVRLDASMRDGVKGRLCQAGIYTISLWTFPEHLDRREFPNAFRLSSEVLNLPLSPWMSADQVDQVCGILLRCIESWKLEYSP
jgi:dTDP-4-amino-4,6-dideoxygalactose transaminase